MKLVLLLQCRIQRMLSQQQPVIVQQNNQKKNKRVFNKSSNKCKRRNINQWRKNLTTLCHLLLLLHTKSWNPLHRYLRTPSPPRLHANHPPRNTLHDPIRLPKLAPIILECPHLSLKRYLVFRKKLNGWMKRLGCMMKSWLQQKRKKRLLLPSRMRS